MFGYDAVARQTVQGSAARCSYSSPRLMLEPAHAPVCVRGRLLLQCGVQQLCQPLFVMTARTPRLKFVVQPVQAPGTKASPPEAYGGLSHTQAPRRFPIREGHN